MARRFATGSSQYFANTGGSPVSTYPFSISAHYTPVAGSQDKAILCLANGADRHLFYQNQTAAAMFSASGGTADQAKSTDGTVLGGVAVRLGGVVASATSRKTYVNGALDGTNTTNVAVGAMAQTYLGAYYGSGVVGGFYANADIAEVGVWDVELTAEEWAALGAGCSPLLIRPQNLRAYWPLLGRATDEEDWVGALPLTNVSVATVIDHPRVIEPYQRQRLFVSSGGGGGTSLSPTPGALTLAGYAPAITQPQSLSPTPGAITLTGYAPSIAQPQTLNPAAGAIALTGYAPTISQVVSISPTPGALVLAGYAPTIAQPHTVAPAPGVITLVGHAPTIRQVAIEAGPPLNRYTIMRLSVINSAAPLSAAAINGTGGNLSANFNRSTIMRATAVSGQAVMTDDPINHTVSLP